MRAAPWAGPVTVAAALGLLLLVLDPAPSDLAAQELRADLFGREGLAVWSNQWYGGHHLPGYSVLAPALGHWLGPPLLGALSVVAAALAASRIAGRDHLGAATWFAFGAGAMLFTGRTTFLLGLALGTACVAAGPRLRPLLAAATALASPLAAAFLALVLVAQRRPGSAAAALVPAAALGILFPEGGVEPFVASAFWPALAACAVVAALVPRRDVRIGATLLAGVLVAAFALDTPLGGNATRLGPLLAGPLLLAFASRRRAVLLLAPALLWWQLYPPIRDVARGHGDPSTQAAYSSGLRAFLRAQDGPPARLEVPFTAGHWEARHLALDVPLARGWERQLDVGRHGLFYSGRLEPGEYRRWLRAESVRWVALPDVPLDASARQEAALLESGLLGRPVWRDPHWRVWEVRGWRPVGVRTLGIDSFATSGPERTSVRWTRWWSVAAGRGCVLRDGERTRTTGPVRVVIDLTRPRRCAP